MWHLYTVEDPIRTPIVFSFSKDLFVVICYSQVISLKIFDKHFFSLVVESFDPFVFCPVSVSDHYFFLLFFTFQHLFVFFTLSLPFTSSISKRSPHYYHEHKRISTNFQITCFKIFVKQESTRQFILKDVTVLLRYRRDRLNSHVIGVHRWLTNLTLIKLSPLFKN